MPELTGPTMAQSFLRDRGSQWIRRSGATRAETAKEQRKIFDKDQGEHKDLYIPNWCFGRAWAAYLLEFISGPGVVVGGDLPG